MATAPSPAKLRVSAISLPRRADRWAACESHLRAVLPPDLPFDMFAGTDARALASGAQHASVVDALEAAAECKIYRGWPITEEDDVRRAFSRLSSLPDGMAWVSYEKCFSRLWRRDRARLYVDFFCRHLTMGDVGAALSHLRLAERAHSEGLELQLVVEEGFVT